MNNIDLLYLNHEYDPGLYINRKFNDYEKLYKIVFRIPYEEMMSNSAKELATNLIILSISPEWMSTGKRSIRIGDRFVYGENIKQDWLFADKKDKNLFLSNGFEVISDNVWNKLILVNLGEYVSEEAVSR